MRAVSIPKAVVDALNEFFDKNPRAVSHLVCVGFRTDASEAALAALETQDRVRREQSHVDAMAGVDPDDGVGMAIAMNRTNLGIPRGGTHRELGMPDGEHVSVLDLINTILEAVAPGKRIVTIHGLDGMDGFTLARERRTASQDEAEDRS